MESFDYAADSSNTLNEGNRRRESVADLEYVPTGKYSNKNGSESYAYVKTPVKDSIKKNAKKPRKNKVNVMPSNITAAPLQNIIDLTDSIDSTDSTDSTDSAESTATHRPIITEGLEPISSSKISAQIKPIVENISKIVSKPVEIFDWSIETFSKKLCDLFSEKGKSKASDVALVRSQIAQFLAICVSGYVVYNWYFLMVYRVFMKRIEVLAISTDDLTQFNRTVSFVFKYLIVPLSLVNSILLTHFPRFMNLFLNNKMQMTALFLIIWSCIYSYSVPLMKAFETYIKMKTDSNTSMINGIMIAFGLTSIFRVKFTLDYYASLMRTVLDYFHYMHLFPHLL